ncbi:hypothetical protein FSP39_006924 [Pinctada imbricata]|uniref:Uncharacterized protein n=1 Tax=Pinctada imbricata TaxID=66713 RepID=A0AA88XL99_PINIB|nr:hypothetical protein FSP39_006924 [Pinctada imbricata]
MALPEVEIGQFYMGSRLLNPLTYLIGLPIDQVNFLACQFIALGIGIYFREHMSPKKASFTQRHLVELCVGVCLTLFCFGYQILHVFAEAAIAYVIMLYAPRENFHAIVFVFSMLYLSIVHIYRQIYDYGGYTLDITGPLMILTQKTTSIAFALHDGTQKSDDQLNPDQKKQKIVEIPSPLAYSSYVFSFHNIMCGPLVFYSDYIHFIEGTDGSYDPPNQGQNHSKLPPSPNDAVKRKLISALINGIITVTSPIFYPVSYLTDDEFLYKSSWLYKNYYVLVCITLVRAKYYLAWELGEAVNNAAGLGFKGWNKDGTANWDLIRNIQIYQLEVSNSLKVNIDSWNIQTLIWLRRIVYDRVPKYSTLAVFMCSAFWHGFYPGYYFTFCGAALATVAARLMRRNVRPLFQGSGQSKHFYDAVTFTFTRFTNVYVTFPFCILIFDETIRVLGSLYFYMHILCIGVYVYFTFIQPPKKQKSEKKE